MGRDARGILFYGVKLTDDLQPWDEDKYDGDEQHWWRDVNGFAPVNEYPFTDDGDYKPGYSPVDPRVDAYFAERRAWEKSHPMPFQLRNIGFSDESEHALCVESLTKTAEWSECTSIPADLLMRDRCDDFYALRNFCVKYQIHTVPSIGWFLTSYYG